MIEPPQFLVRFAMFISIAYLGLQAGTLCASTQSMTIEDVLALERIDRVTASPDGSLVAAVVLRAASADEVYGRTFYELDPSRADVFVIDRKSATSQNVTKGKALASGAWCATWSPDGSLLAMLSTRPEGSEPKGGDNVRLYVWERDNNKLRRLGDWPVMTQTRAGSPLHGLDVASPGQSRSDPCANGEETPPFIWLDSRRLLMVALPDGQKSGLLDEAEREYRRNGLTRDALRYGQTAVVSAAGSGDERTVMLAGENMAVLAIVDAFSGQRTDLAEVPAYPFHGALGIRVTADGQKAVVLAPTAMIPYREGVPVPSLDSEWFVEKRLGIIRLDERKPVQWLALPAAARLPLRLGAWSADHDSLALTARATDIDTEERHFVLDLKSERLASSNAPIDPPAKVESIKLPQGARLLVNDAHGFVWSHETSKGSFLRSTDLGAHRSKDLLRLNNHMSRIDLGTTRLIDYRSTNGVALKGLVLLPPGYKSGTLLPVITWVYGGYSVRGLDDYFAEPYMPGLYNLRLYTSRGYAVLIPSIPLKRDGSENQIQQLVPSTVPAVDRLVELGIADPERIGVMGQSYGGFATLGLVTQTSRFRAAVAISAISDFTAMSAAFDPTASSYDGIEHEKSLNIPILEAGQGGMLQPFTDNPDRYQLASPLHYVDRVVTPVLLVHGENDTRGTAYQSEAFFTGLWRQGKTARVLKYAGENHGLALSPATARSVVHEVIEWFDKYLSPSTVAVISGVKPTSKSDEPGVFQE